VLRQVRHHLGGYVTLEILPSDNMVIISLYITFQFRGWYATFIMFRWCFTVHHALGEGVYHLAHDRVLRLQLNQVPLLRHLLTLVHRPLQVMQWNRPVNEMVAYYRPMILSPTLSGSLVVVPASNVTTMATSMTLSALMGRLSMMMAPTTLPSTSALVSVPGRLVQVFRRPEAFEEVVPTTMATPVTLSALTHNVDNNNANESTSTTLLLLPIIGDGTVTDGNIMSSSNVGSSSNNNANEIAYTNANDVDSDTVPFDTVVSVTTTTTTTNGGGITATATSPATATGTINNDDIDSSSSSSSSSSNADANANATVPTLSSDEGEDSKGSVDVYRWAKDGHEGIVTSKKTGCTLDYFKKVPITEALSSESISQPRVQQKVVSTDATIEVSSDEPIDEPSDVPSDVRSGVPETTAEVTASERLDGQEFEVSEHSDNTVAQTIDEAWVVLYPDRNTVHVEAAAGTTTPPGPGPTETAPGSSLSSESNIDSLSTTFNVESPSSTFAVDNNNDYERIGTDTNTDTNTGTGSAADGNIMSSSNGDSSSNNNANEIENANAVDSDTVPFDTGVSVTTTTAPTNGGRITATSPATATGTINNDDIDSSSSFNANANANANDTVPTRNSSDQQSNGTNEESTQLSSSSGRMNKNILGCIFSCYFRRRDRRGGT